MAANIDTAMTVKNHGAPVSPDSKGLSTLTVNASLKPTVMNEKCVGNP